jgi:glycosyltransferase 2 family protein
MRWLKAVLLLTILACFYLFVQSIDMHKVVTSLQQVGYCFLYLLLVTFCAYWMAIIAWSLCMGKESQKVSFVRLFLIRHVGETISTINPTSIVAGEALKMYLLSKKGVSRQTILLSVLISRLLMIITQILILSLAFGGLLLLSRSLSSLSLGPTGIYTIVFLLSFVLLWLASKTTIVQGLVTNKKKTPFLAKHAGKLLAKLREWKIDFINFFLHYPKAVVWSSLCFMAHWLLGSLEFYLILYLLNVKASLLQALLVDMGVIVFKSAGAFVPGQLGVEEYGNKIMLTLIGIVDEQIWITASILRRTRQLCWIVFGLIAYFFLQHKRNVVSKKSNGNSVCKSQDSSIYWRNGKAKL